MIENTGVAMIIFINIPGSIKNPKASTNGMEPDVRLIAMYESKFNSIDDMKVTVNIANNGDCHIRACIIRTKNKIDT